MPQHADSLQLGCVTTTVDVPEVLVTNQFTYKLI
jgi:hypothetical protein